MSKHIADFLIELSKNPLFAEQFRKDRVQAIAAAGFTGQEAELLRISDPRVWGENFTEIRLQDGIEPGGESFEAEFDISIGEPLGQGKKPPRAPSKPKVGKKKPAKKVSRKPAPKIAKKIAKKTAKKKGGRK